MAPDRTPAADDATTTRSTRKGEPAAMPPGAATRPAPDQATASPAGPRVPASKPAGVPTPAPVEPGNVPTKPAPAPTAATPAAQPAGDYATLAANVPGATYAIIEDGVGVLTVPTDELFTAAAWAKSHGYPLLSLLSAYDRVDHFGVLYAFVKLATKPAEFGELRLRVVMPKKAGDATVEPTCPSLCDLFPAADWQEREMHDMYGIRFEGHPDLRRMFLPEDWSGYPMRKDNKEPEQFVALREGEDITVKTPQEGAW